MSEEIGIKIFTGTASATFAKQMCRYLGTEVGQSQTITFSEGNIFVKILEKVRDKDVYIVQTIGLKPNDDFMELLLIDAFNERVLPRLQPLSLISVMPRGIKRTNPGFLSVREYVRTALK